MKHVQAIEYRNKTEPPTEPGWYWARGRGEPEITPVYVYFVSGFDPTGVVECVGTELLWKISDFDFFGPVRIVKEG